MRILPFRMGSRVQLIADPGGWIPLRELGAIATVTGISSAGISLHVEGFGEWRSRYLPRSCAARCLRVLEAHRCG